MTVPTDMTPPRAKDDAVAERYYNPLLDPAMQEKMTPAMRKAVIDGEYVEGDGGPLYPPDLDHPANLSSSLHTDGYHRPTLDIDIRMEVVPSRTSGHWHVTFPDLALSWSDYRNLLDALATAGILEPAYVKHSKVRGQTLVRIPPRPEPVDPDWDEPY